MSQSQHNAKAPGPLCPIPRAHRKLLDAYNLWHQTAANYTKPDLFRANLNATIQALRNITFAIQADKHAFDDFDTWYDPWQTRMRASSILGWAKDARNIVVKQGDLNTASTATVRLFAQKDRELARLPVAPDTLSEVIIKNIRIWESIAKAKDGDLSDAIVEIERQWSLPDFQDREVLDTLAAAYGLLSDLVVDAHTHLGRLDCIDRASSHPYIRAAHHRSGALPCMTATSEFRKERFSLSTGDHLLPVTQRVPDPAPLAEIVAARYGIKGAELAASWRQADPDLMAERIVYWSKKMLKRDRAHIRIVFIRDGGGQWHARVLYAANRVEKHMVVRMIAQFVKQAGADAIIDVGEAWYLARSEQGDAAKMGEVISKAQNKIIYRDLEEVPGRREALQVLVASREGLLRTYVTPFSRGPLGGIKFDHTRVSDGSVGDMHYLYPVFRVWSTQGVLIGEHGQRRPWLWEPDPLDTCYCGGPGRFGACCGQTLRDHSMKELQRLREDALERSDFPGAERFARAALAKYVIWVRSHTAPTRHVAEKLHQRMVGIDIAALEACVRQLEHDMDIVGRKAELLSKLRRIEEVIGVPEVSIRLIALAAEVLYEVGTRADAAAELDRLGDLDEVSDAMALRVAARVFDGEKEESYRLLQRALDHAVNDGERFAIELELAGEYYRRGDDGRALELTNRVVSQADSRKEHGGMRAGALELRWRLTGSAADFGEAKRCLETIGDAAAKRRLLVMLIDNGDLEEAEEFVGDGSEAGDVVGELLAVDIRLKTDRVQEAEARLRGIAADQITERLRLPYAHVMGLVALRAGRTDLAATAAAMLRCIESEEGGLAVGYGRMVAELERLGDGRGRV